MSRYLLKVEELYRADMEGEADALIEEMKKDSSFELVNFSSTKKVTKDDEYYLVKIKKIFNNEKKPV
jgi:hypothetical protein